MFSAEFDLAAFIDWTKEIFSQYFQVIRKLLVESYKPSPFVKDDIEKEHELDKNSGDLKIALEQLSSDLTIIHNKVPGAALADKLMNHLSDAVANFLEQNMNYIKENMQKEFNELTKLTFKVLLSTCKCNHYTETQGQWGKFA